MTRKAFLMRVLPARQAEYERHHSPIWSELGATLKAHGAHNYSVFLHPETGQLFACVGIESEKRRAALAQAEVVRRWWASMTDLMPANADGSLQSTELRSVIHFD